MRVLVTGGAGFIGSHLVERIVERFPDWDIVVFDAFTYAGRPENLVGVETNPKVAICQGDLRWPAEGVTHTTLTGNKEVLPTLYDAIQGCDHVLHLAAESHVDRSIVGAAPFVETNVLGTYHVLDAAYRFGVQKVVYASTDEVYGSAVTGRFDEMDPLCPSSPYSASKAAGEMLALSYWRTHQLPVVITRGSNTLGPRQHPEKLIPKVILKALDWQKVPVYGSGDQVRDWMWVGDHVDGILNALLHGESGEVYNLGAGNERQNTWIINRILQKLGRPSHLVTHVADRKGHDYRYAIDSSRAKWVLKWQPQLGLEAALDRTIDWYRDNPEWWKPLLSGL